MLTNEVVSKIMLDIFPNFGVARDSIFRKKFLLKKKRKKFGFNLIVLTV